MGIHALGDPLTAIASCFNDELEKTVLLYCFMLRLREKKSRKSLHSLRVVACV